MVDALLSLLQSCVRPQVKGRAAALMAQLEIDEAYRLFAQVCISCHVLKFSNEYMEVFDESRKGLSLC